MAFACPICDDALSSPPPNYHIETVRAQEAAGDPVIVAEVSGPSPRGRARVARLTKKQEKPPKVGRSTAVSTPCGHLFHVACVEEWFKNTNPRTCPTCRKPCPSTKMVPIFPVIADHSRLGADDQSSTSTAARSGARGVNTGLIVINVPDPAPAPPQQNRNNPDEDLRQMHNMLMQDYEELQGRYHEEVDKVAMSQAIINSLQTMCDELKQEVETRKKAEETLKKEVDTLKKVLKAQPQTGNRNSAATSTQAGAPATVAPATPARRGKGKQTTVASGGGGVAHGRGTGVRAGTSKAKAAPPLAPAPDAPAPKRARRSCKRFSSN